MMHIPLDHFGDNRAEAWSNQRLTLCQGQMVMGKVPEYIEIDRFTKV